MHHDIPDELYARWGNRRYYAFGQYLRDRFGQRIGKISLDAGHTCPNRDGTVGTEGCTFCRPDTFAGNKLLHTHAVQGQIAHASAYLLENYRYHKYLAYFQTYTNTHAPAPALRALYQSALSMPDIVGIAIATRPDCLSEEILEILSELNDQTYLLVELGLQSAHDKTLRYINRGHDYACFAESCRSLRRRNIDICTHIIAGLPGEDLSMMLETIRQLNSLEIQGIKIHQLQIIEGTAMAQEHAAGTISTLELHEFLDWIPLIVAEISPETAIHRLFSRAAKQSIISPKWGKTRQQIQIAIEKQLEKTTTWQGKNTHPT